MIKTKQNKKRERRILENKTYKSITLQFDVRIAVNLEPQTAEIMSSSNIQLSSKEIRVGVG